LAEFPSLTGTSPGRGICVAVDARLRAAIQKSALGQDNVESYFTFERKPAL
jgi:hypothetical protein